MINIRIGDALSELAKVASGSVDLIFTDPPYWTLDKWRNTGTTTRLGGNSDKEKQTGWFKTIDHNDLWNLMLECYRVLRKNRHCCIMADGQTLRYILGYYEEADFSYAKPIVWDKVDQGMGYHLRCRHEFVVLMDKGKNRMPKDRGLPDIITIPMVKGGYPTEKPVMLPQFFIEQYTDPGELVLDPFSGSGSTMIAAKQLGRRGLAFDINPECERILSERLLQITPPLDFEDV